MIDFLILVSERPVVITLALLGAALVIAGSLTARPIKPGHTPSSLTRQSALSRGLTIVGYTITGGSILLFIIAGFVSDIPSSLD